MCDYVNKNELVKPRKIFSEWISNVQREIKKEYGITFSYNPIGSGSRNMVIRKCDNDYFDLDFQIVMQSIPNDMDWDGDCKEFKDIFRNTFNKYKPQGFKDCKSSLLYSQDFFIWHPPRATTITKTVFAILQLL